MIKVPIETSARHLHLSQTDLNKLFGKNYKLTRFRKLSQPGEFAAKEMVEVQNLKSWGAKPHMDFTFGRAPNHNKVRVVGPVRNYTQLELSWSDFICLGLKPKVALSGNLKQSSGGVILIGPKGEVKLNQGVIIAKSHIHCNLETAQKYQLKNNQEVSVKTISLKSEHKLIRQITFHQVVIRINPKFKWSMHIDTDQANAAGIVGFGWGKIII